MKKIIVTGGPKTGALNVINDLKFLHPEFCYVPNVEGLVTIGEKSEKKYPKFGELMLAKALELEEQIPQDTEVVVLDGSIIDIWAKARMKSADKLAARAEGYAKTAGYTLAFVCDFANRAASGRIAPTIRQAQNELWITYSMASESGVKNIMLSGMDHQNRMKVVEETLASL